MLPRDDCDTPPSGLNEAGSVAEPRRLAPSPPSGQDASLWLSPSPSPGQVAFCQHFEHSMGTESHVEHRPGPGVPEGRGEVPLLGTDASEPRRVSGRAAASLCRSTVVMPATRSSRCACSRLARRPPARSWPKRSSTWAPHRLRRLPPERVSRGQEQYCRAGKGESPGSSTTRTSFSVAARVLQGLLQHAIAAQHIWNVLLAPRLHVSHLSSHSKSPQRMACTRQRSGGGT